MGQSTKHKAQSTDQNPEPSVRFGYSGFCMCAQTVKRDLSDDAGSVFFEEAFERHWRSRGEDQTWRLWRLVLGAIGAVLLFFGLMAGLHAVAGGTKASSHRGIESLRPLVCSAFSAFNGGGS